MTIVSSTTEVSTQADGRRWVNEVHTDQYGATYARAWLAPVEGDLDAPRIAYAAQLASELVSREIDENIGRMRMIGSLATLTTLYCTLVQIRTALRVAYQDAVREEAIMLGDFLSGLTDAQLQLIFGKTASQVTALRTAKLAPAASLAATLRNAAGA